LDKPIYKVGVSEALQQFWTNVNLTPPIDDGPGLGGHWQCKGLCCSWQVFILPPHKATILVNTAIITLF